MLNVYKIHINSTNERLRHFTGEITPYYASCIPLSFKVGMWEIPVFDLV